MGGTQTQQEVYAIALLSLSNKDIWHSQLLPVTASPGPFVKSWVSAKRNTTEHNRAPEDP
jgi:hypothetical protein